jgi:hypothetical protein
VYYLAAHELKLRYDDVVSGGNGSGAGPIQSETVDKDSYTNAVQSMDVENGSVRLASTSYGLKYLELQKKVAPVGFMVI